jgi:acyl-CoA synthetase (NDP forming)
MGNEIKEISLIFEGVKKEKRKILYPAEAETVLAYYGIDSVQSAYCHNNLDALSEAADRIGFPVALKLTSPDILHKSDAGYVILNINGLDALATAHHDILQRVKCLDPHARIEGILVQKMIQDGHEVIIGLTSDPTFGKIIIFGLGGIFVEILEDVAIRKIPISTFDAEDMIAEIKGLKILQGARGKEPANLRLLQEVLLKASRMGEEMEEIREMDLNPLFVNAHRSLVADTRIIVE